MSSGDPAPPAANVAPQALADDVKTIGHALGFDLVGIARAEPTPETRFLHDWLARGYGGEMHYLARRADEREDPRRVLEGARSIIAVGLDYDVEPVADPSGPGATSEANAEGASARARIARYAGGADYHGVLLERLRALGTAVQALVDHPVAMRAYVDTGPIQERVYAAYAGLGWLGKNTLLIHPKLGSYVFLGVLLCDLDLPADERAPDQCGTCRACLDACPTDAFVEPYVLDATRCLAYTTIEDPGPIDANLRVAHGDRVFGCDVCQEVCPWNQRRARQRPGDPLGLRSRLATRPEWQGPPLGWLLDLSEEEFRRHTVRSPIRRAGHRGLIRNALVAAGNSRDPALIAHVRPHCESPDEMIAEHARWALEQIDSS